MTNYRRVLGDGKCQKCRGPLGVSFQRIRLDMGVINVRAVKRHMGLSAMLGSSALADVMGPGEEQVAFTGDKDKLCISTHLVCHECYVEIAREMPNPKTSVEEQNMEPAKP